MKRSRYARYGSEAALLLLLLLLVKMDRMTWGGLLVPLALIVMLEVGEKVFGQDAARQNTCLFLAAFVLWIFNDLMAIGRFSVVGWKTGFINYLFYVMLFSFFRGILGNRKTAYIIPEVLLLLLGLTNAVVKAIRRTPISAGDLFSIKTAMAVAGNYSMEFDRDLVLKIGAGLVLVALTDVILVCVLKGDAWNGQEKEQNEEPWTARIADTAVPVIWTFMLFGTSWLVTYSGRTPDYFTHETNGFALNLYLQWKDIKIAEPDGYQPEAVQELAGLYPSDAAVTGAELPNIIVIMNESFADLRVLGAYETNIDVLPVLDSLEEDTVHGSLYASVYGGNTANSEYEFLTGSSIAYFSERVVPFQLYMNEARASMISQARQMGYQTVFMHPYRAYSWNRPSVYTALQTDEMIFEEDMEALSYIRSYASDASQYAYIRRYLEQEDRTQPLFLFDVTVQNHGGYTGAVDELSEKVTIKGHEGEFTETENYLTLVHESDRALGELLAYLEDFDEPVAVLFFGDHQPAIETAFIEMAMGKPQSEFTLEDRQKMYTVPFFLWSNRGLQAEQIDRMSMNYLSAFLCNELGLPRTGLQKYLTDLYQEMPVINSVAVSDAKGSFFLKTDLEEAQDEKFMRYSSVIYDYMFGGAGRQDALFRLQD